MTKPIGTDLASRIRRHLNGGKFTDLRESESLLREVAAHHLPDPPPQILLKEVEFEASPARSMPHPDQRDGEMRFKFEFPQSAAGWKHWDVIVDAVKNTVDRINRERGCDA